MSRRRVWVGGLTGSVRSLGVALAVLASATASARDGDTRLPDAARTGDLSAVERLLAGRVSPDAADQDGMSALHWAVYRNDLEMARRLVDAKADVNLANRHGAVPLSSACTNADPRMTALLLGAGADAQAAPRGEPVLHTAARTGSVEVVRQLLEHKADIDQPEPLRQQTALMWAAAEGHTAVVQALVAAGAGPGARSSAGYTALMFAARQGHLDTVRALVDAGADPNVASKDGLPVLMLAIDQLRYEVAGLLLDRGARPNTPNKQGDTALHRAVRGRAPTRRRRAFDEALSADLLKQLLARGADPNARTPKAPRLTDAMVASSLRPAIDNVVNLGGATPFLLAAQAADLTAMRILLEGGADPRLPTYENTTTLMMAAGVGFVEGRERTRPERDALQAVTLLVEAGVDPNAVNERGQTALHGAVYRAGNSIIEFLAARGAPLDVRDELGRTPLQLAETGFNQVSSVIRRESAAALLRRLAAPSSAEAR
jgi:ankyrin repeat protein